MDDFGDLLYFVLLIGFSIIGALAKKKKKNSETEQKAEVPPSSTSDPWEEFDRRLKESQEIFNSPAPEPKMVVEREPISQRQQNHSFSGYESFDTTDDISKMRIKKQMKESVAQNSSSFKRQEQNQPVNTLQNEYHITFEEPETIKKAIIYSEIFGRKFF